MKIGLIGDCHFTNKKPDRRLDDYWATQLIKFNEAIQIFSDNECECMIQTGDFFDNPMTPYCVISKLILMLNTSKFCKLYLVFGQHDIWGHSASTLPNSPLSVMESAGVVRILDQNRTNIGGINLYGAGFGEKIELPIVDGYNVLVVHRMIGNRQLYPGQELEDPRLFLKNHPWYNLVVCGDYHYRFIDKYDGKVIINPGALVRKTISAFDMKHEPAVIIFDTETNEAKIIKLTTKPVNEVFDLTRERKKDCEILNRFIEGLKNRTKIDIGWKHNLIKIMNERKASIEARKIINECMGETK